MSRQIMSHGVDNLSDYLVGHSRPMSKNCSSLQSFPLDWSYGHFGASVFNTKQTTIILVISLMRNNIFNKNGVR